MKESFKRAYCGKPCPACGSISLECVSVNGQNTVRCQCGTQSPASLWELIQRPIDVLELRADEILEMSDRLIGPGNKQFTVRAVEGHKVKETNPKHMLVLGYWIGRMHKP